MRIIFVKQSDSLNSLKQLLAAYSLVGFSFLIQKESFGPDPVLIHDHEKLNEKEAAEVALAEADPSLLVLAVT